MPRPITGTIQIKKLQSRLWRLVTDIPRYMTLELTVDGQVGKFRDPVVHFSNIYYAKEPNIVQSKLNIIQEYTNT
jgi:hypothetical protein